MDYEKARAESRKGRRSASLVSSEAHRTQLASRKGDSKEGKLGGEADWSSGTCIIPFCAAGEDKERQRDPGDKTVSDETENGGVMPRYGHCASSSCLAECGLIIWCGGEAAVIGDRQRELGNSTARRRGRTEETARLEYAWASLPGARRPEKNGQDKRARGESATRPCFISEQGHQSSPSIGRRDSVMVPPEGWSPCLPSPGRLEAVRVLMRTEPAVFSIVSFPSRE